MFTTWFVEFVVPTLEYVRDRIAKSDVLRSKPHLTVFHYIRNFIEKNKPKLPAESTPIVQKSKMESWLQSNDDSETASSLSFTPRLKWFADDHELILRVFSSEIHGLARPKRKYIIARFETDPQLLELYTRQSTKEWKDRCIEKVRTEFKKMQKTY